MKNKDIKIKKYFMNIFNSLNISSIANHTSNVLNIIKKSIPVYKEIRPLINKNKNIINHNIIESKKESNEEYNNSLTFFQ